jgi:pyruvate dehydrogenase E2 component (dihydrolipoamide acetyltransferase)
MGTLQEIRVPDIGDFKNVTVIDIYVKEGDEVEAGMDLVAVETDKAAMDVPSPHAGVIRELIVKLGDTISEGSLLLRIETALDDAVETQLSNAISVAEIAEHIPEERQSTSSAPTEKSLSELPRAQNPKLTSPERVEVKPDVTESAHSAMAYASPSVRKLARELGVALHNVSGTGPRGRITREDVQSFVKKVMSEQSALLLTARNDVFADLAPWPQFDYEKFGEIERRELSRIRKITAANLHRNWVMIPHVTNHEDADITELEAFRVALNEEHAGSGVKVTLLAMIMKACVAALQGFPEFNASLDGDALVLKRYYHIGFAADTPKGLVVPVIKDVDKKGILVIAKEMAELSAKAREGKLSVAEMSGGSFSISSLGGIGGTYFTPIINAPEVAILGVSKSRTTMIWNGKKAVPRLMLPLSLSWDHRVIDGAAAGRFNAYLASTLADFRRILL